MLCISKIFVLYNRMLQFNKVNFDFKENIKIDFYIKKNKKKRLNSIKFSKFKS